MRLRKALSIPFATLVALALAGQASAADGLLSGGALAPVTQAVAPVTQAVAPVTQPVAPVTQAAAPVTQAAEPVTQAALR